MASPRKWEGTDGDAGLGTTERFRDVILETLPMADMLSVVVTMHPRAAVTIGTAWFTAGDEQTPVDIEQSCST